MTAIRRSGEMLYAVRRYTYAKQNSNRLYEKALPIITECIIVSPLYPGNSLPDYIQSDLNSNSINKLLKTYPVTLSS